MKNNTLTFADFQLETISRKQQKTIKGGDDPIVIDPNEPKKNGGGNGNN